MEILVVSTKLKTETLIYVDVFCNCLLMRHLPLHAKFKYLCLSTLFTIIVNIDKNLFEDSTYLNIRMLISNHYTNTIAPK